MALRRGMSLRKITAAMDVERAGFLMPAFVEAHATTYCQHEAYKPAESISLATCITNISSYVPCFVVDS